VVALVGWGLAVGYSLVVCDGGGDGSGGTVIVAVEVVVAAQAISLELVLSKGYAR
jgi:hypothetical protein